MKRRRTGGGARRTRPRSSPAATGRAKIPVRTRDASLDSVGIDLQEIESLRAEVERLGARSAPPRWNADPEDVRKSVGKLVLTLVEFVRQLLERQAIRRMDAGTLTAEQTESIGLALMRLEETVRDLGAQFGLSPEDLNLDLGPLGKLM
jgi:hypothetical protein